jgi:hypothetical protein
MNSLRNEITAFGQVRNSDAFGPDYLSELRRILQQHVRPVTRAFLEWGTGNTTLAIIQWHDMLQVDNFFSIDDNAAYLEDLVRQFPPWSGFHPIHADLIGPKAGDRDPELNYSTLPLTLAAHFDFIFIDGRRRMECALMAALMCHQESVVVLHDYRRRRYQPVKALYDIVEDGSQFRVMRPRRSLGLAEARNIYPPFSNHSNG